MALTDEQYQQIFRYADDEMSPDELKAFEASLLENKELQGEVEFYKQVRLLSESVEEKTRGAYLSPAEEKKSSAEEIGPMLADARKKWENQYEDELKLKYGITEAITIATSGQKNKKRSINFSVWLIAASLIGLISLGILWWYNQDKKDNSTVSNNTKKTDSTGVTNSKTRDSTGNNIQIQPTPQPETASSGNIAERTEDDKWNTLFANNFKPDSVPRNKEGALETAFGYYEDGQFQKASREFENADIGPATRGDEDYRNLMRFYIHYYQALSYMAENINISKSISELQKAINISPNAAWKTKSQWYLALAHLKKGETKTAQALLKQVADNHDVEELKRRALALSEALAD